VPEVLKRAIDKDNVKIVIDDSVSLKGSVPEIFEGSEGRFLDGNLFLADPYESAFITEEMVHYVDKKMDFSESEKFISSAKFLLDSPGLPQTIGFILNKNYIADIKAYDDVKGVNIESELLTDMYVIRNGFIKGQPLNNLSAEILDVNQKQSIKISYPEALQSFYNRIVRGKTPEEIEAFYDNRRSIISNSMKYTDQKGYALALALAKVPEQKIDEICKNLNNPEALLKTLYPKEMIEQLDKFTAKMNEQYPAPQTSLEPINLQQKNVFPLH
jgi:hypothetical protein